MVNQETNIVETIQSLRYHEEQLRKLEFLAIVEWGEMYWLNKNFQKDEMAFILKAVSREVKYYQELINQSICLN
jgi:hypothetical protein